MGYSYNGILSSFKKEGSLAICDNIDELGRPYAKGNKPGTEEQIFHDPTLCEESKIIKLIEA